MSRCPTRRPSHPLRSATDRPLTVDHLAGALDVFDAQLGTEAAPHILRLRHLDAGAVELATVPLDEHPLELLTAFDAPPDWSAVGVAASGIGREVGPAGEPAAGGDGETGRVLHLVARSGSWASRWRGHHIAGGDHRIEPGGRIDDACRLALGLPTAPPDIDLLPLLAFVWLDAVLGRAATRVALSWPEVALLHPVFVLADDVAIDGPPEGFADDVLDALAPVDWAAARVAAAVEVWRPPGIAGGRIAEWLDDGAFSRWVLGALAEPREVAAALADLVTPDVLDGIEAALAWWAVAP